MVKLLEAGRSPKTGQTRQSGTSDAFLALHFPGRTPPSCHPSRSATHSKQRSCHRSQSAKQKPLSSVFHGKFFRCSQVTANLTVANRFSAALQDSSRIEAEFPLVALCQISLHCIVIALRLQQQKERGPNEEPTEDAGDAGACLGMSMPARHRQQRRVPRVPLRPPLSTPPRRPLLQKAFGGEPDSIAAG